MKKVTNPINWAAVAQQMAEDKRRIEAAVGEKARKSLNGITFVHPLALPADRS